MRVTLQKLHADKMFSIQNEQRSEVLYMAGVVPAGASGVTIKVAVSNLGHFYTNFITGSFETKSGAAADDGIDKLSGILRDGNGNRQLFNDYVPFSLWMTPGRRKSLPAAGADSNTLFYPIPFEYLFTANSDIQLDCRNVATVDLAFSVAFHGIRLLSTASVTGVRR